MLSPTSNIRPAISEEHWGDLLTSDWREPGDLNATLNHIAKVAKRIFTADLCVIWAVNPITGRFVLEPGVEGDLRSDPDENPLQAPRNHGLTKRVIVDGYYAREDLAGFAEIDRGFCQSQHLVSFAAIALHTLPHKRPFAVLYVDYRRSVAFDDNSEKRLRRFAQLASRELQVTWFLRRYQWVGQIGERISRHFQNEVDLFGALWSKVRHIIDTSHCLLCAVYHPENDTIDVLSHVGSRVMVDEGRAIGPSLERFLRGKIQIVKDLNDEPTNMLDGIEELAGSMSWQPRSAVLVPLSKEERPLGFLSVQHPEPNAYDHEDRHLLELVGHQVSLALSNLRLYNHLNKLHEVGKTLTRDLESKRVLQAVVKSIRATTDCDLAILYPYSAATRSFEMEPESSGDFRTESMHLETGDIVDAGLLLRETRFAEKAQEVYHPSEGFPGGRRGSFQEREGIRSVAVLPLRLGEGDDEAVGVLFVNYRTPQRFKDDPALRQLIQGVAAYAAIAIKNAREFGAERSRHVKALEALRDLDRELSQKPDDLERLLRLVLKLACKGLGKQVDEASVALFDRYKDQLITRAAIGDHSQENKRQVLRPEQGRGIALEVLRTGEPLLVRDVNAPEWKDRFVSIGGSTRCEMDVPLMDGHQVLGIINLESQRPGAFDRTDLQLMKTFAGQAVLAVKTAQAYEQQKRLREDESTLIELGKMLTQRLDVDGLLPLILSAAIENSKADAGVLVLVDPTVGDLIVKAEQGVSNSNLNRRLSRDEGILGLVAQDGEMINADLTDPKWRKIHIPVKEGMNSELALPLKRRERTVGVLNVESRELRYFSQRNKKLLTGLADLAVIALQNADRFEKSEKNLKLFEVLYKASQELARITSQDQLDSAYEVIVSLAAKQWNCEVVVRRMRPEGLLLVKSTGQSDPAPYKVIPLSDPVAGKVATERSTIYVPDALEPPRGVGNFPRSNTKDRAFIVTHISFEDDYYGNLALSHPGVDHFRDADVRLVEGLAKQLAVALHRIEEVEAHQKAEKRALEAEKMGEVGRQTYELMHRLGNDLGLTRTSVRNIRAALGGGAAVDPKIEAELGHIHDSVSSVLSVSYELGNELSADRHGEPKDRRGDPKLYPIKVLLQDGINSLSLDVDARRKIHIESPTLAEDLGKVEVDYGRFSDAFLNLLRNAVQAMMPDGGRLTVEVRRRGPKCEIRVRDTGHGIDARYHEKIFDLGFSTKSGNSGFGLWSARRTLVDSGGDIACKSQLGKGTEFTITLPCVEEKPRA